jgi:prophage DNA circulation protein
MADEVFGQYPSASWKVAGGAELVFPVEAISESGGNRIVPRERPYRDGAKLDDVGSSPVCWSFTCLFTNTIQEGNKTSKPLYPNVLNEMIRSFSNHETGDLVVPTIGKVRARAKTYRRDESYDVRDSAKVTFEFEQDNEDKVDATAFKLPTVRATVVLQAETATFSAESDAAFDPTLADLNEFAAGLEAIASFPSDTLGDIDQQAGAVAAAAERVLNAFTSKSNNPKEKARAMLSDPDGSITQRKLVQLQDTSWRARAEIRANTPPIVRQVFEVPMTIFDVAARLGQDTTKLLALNAGLDPLFIPPGTVVKVFDAP